MQSVLDAGLEEEVALDSVGVALDSVGATCVGVGAADVAASVELADSESDDEHPATRSSTTAEPASQPADFCVVRIP